MHNTPAYSRELIEKKRTGAKRSVVVGMVSTVIFSALGMGLGGVPYGFIVALLGTLGTLIYSLYMNEDALSDEVTALRDTIEAKAECIFVGHVSTAAGGFRARVQNAERVRNTFVSFGLSDEDGEFRQYTSGLTHRQRMEIVDSVVKQKKPWTDIFSEEVLRKEEEPREEKGGISLRTLVADKQKKEPTYEARFLSESYPIINCSLIDFGKDGKSEVLFGWGFHPRERSGSVYSSKDPYLYRLFDRYWQTLKDDSSPVWSINQTTMITHDITGLWITQAFERNTQGRAQMATGLTDQHTQVDQALVEISIVKNRNPFVEIRRYAPSGEKLDTLNSKACDFREQELWMLQECCGAFYAGSYRFIRDYPSLQEQLTEQQFSNLSESEKEMSQLVVERLCGEFKGFFKETKVIEVYGLKVLSEKRFPEDHRRISDLLEEYSKKIREKWGKTPSRASSENVPRTIVDEVSAQQTSPSTNFNPSTIGTKQKDSQETKTQPEDIGKETHSS